MKRLLLFVLIIMGFCGRFASDAKRCPVAQVVVEPVEPLLVRPVQDDMQCRLWVDSVLDRLSLKERVGQLFIYLNSATLLIVSGHCGQNRPECDFSCSN